MPAKARFPRSMARVQIAALPWRVSRPQVRPRAWLARFAPTRRSLAVGFGMLAFALGAYMLARESSLFAVTRIEVAGGSPQVARQVRRALGLVVGKPLVGLNGSAVLRQVDALPTVVSASYDRAFPHTLRITIVPERPVAVLRRGVDSWLISLRGRVIDRLPAHADASLPRIWVPARTRVHAGVDLAGSTRVAARAVGLAGALVARVTTASYGNGELLFHLRSGLELLLGAAGDVKLKAAVAQRALALLPAGSTYLDVSVPGRPVAGTGVPPVSPPQSSSRG